MRLKTYLKRKGETIRGFARRIETTPSAMHRYVTGAAVPPPRVMVAVHRATQGAVDPNSFYDLAPTQGDIEALIVEGAEAVAAGREAAA